MKRVCIDCIYHVLSEDGSCVPCEQEYMQDETIALICNTKSHGCRGWGKVCPFYTVECCPDRCTGPYDIWDNMKCSKRSPNGILCNNESSSNFGGRCIERIGL